MSYKIIQDSPHRYKIDVTVSGQKQFLKEAKKDALFGLAYIQKAAKKGDLEGLELQRLYEQYVQFLSSERRTPFATTPLLQAVVPAVEASLKLPAPRLISNRLIKTEGPYSAFPDCIRTERGTFIAFREGSSHQGNKDFGTIHILKKEQEEWVPYSRLALPEHDLRDPRFFLDASGDIRLIIGASLPGKKRVASYTATLEGALLKTEVDAKIKGKNGYWIWRLTWNPEKKRAFGFSYSDRGLFLVATDDGVHFKTVCKIHSKVPLNEGVIRFKENGEAIALIRGKGGGLIGTSSEEYTSWSFQKVPFRLGGPTFILEREGIMWAATRYFFLNRENVLEERTLLAKMTTSELIPLFVLPAGVDTGYPALLWNDDGTLSVIYYLSTDGEKSSIYLATFLLQSP